MCECEPKRKIITIDVGSMSPRQAYKVIKKEMRKLQGLPEKEPYNVFKGVVCGFFGVMATLLSLFGPFNNLQIIVLAIIAGAFLAQTIPITPYKKN